MADTYTVTLNPGIGIDGSAATCLAACCCLPCACLESHAGALCVDFGTAPGGAPCPNLYGPQELDPAFPTDGDGHATNCEWAGPMAEGVCGGWTLFWDCDHWSLVARGATYTCAAADFNCVTGRGTFAGGGDGFPGSVSVAPC